MGIRSDLESLAAGDDLPARKRCVQCGLPIRSGYEYRKVLKAWTGRNDLKLGDYCSLECAIRAAEENPG